MVETTSQEDQRCSRLCDLNGYKMYGPYLSSGEDEITK